MDPYKQPKVDFLGRSITRTEALAKTQRFEFKSTRCGWPVLTRPVTALALRNAYARSAERHGAQQGSCQWVAPNFGSLQPSEA